ncbi:replication terminator protein [Paraliobacillus zengyii]|uniref:replication terminator protein n=1 Tax=Paraliobacillus zengyii TaxID=2213194 RepID=UPI000DD2D8C8|nr:replication terminator protein [Paraliobacillus zengyii]
MTNYIVDLNTFANGALAEQFDYELKKVLENIGDPNTDPEKKRKLQVNLVLKADERRQLTDVVVEVKSTLTPRNAVLSSLIMDRDENGVATAAELKSGLKDQTYFDSDTGEIKDDRGQNIVDLQKQGGKK